MLFENMAEIKKKIKLKKKFQGFSPRWTFLPDFEFIIKDDNKYF